MTDKCDSNFTSTNTGGATGTVAGLRVFKWCYVDTAIALCSVSCGRHEYELDAKGNIVAGTEKFYDKDGNAFAMPLASTIQERECPVVPTTPPPTPPAELTFNGQDCEGSVVPVTGTEGQIMQAVQPAGTVYKVQLCEGNEDFELSCGVDPLTGHQVQTAYKIVAGNFEVINRWDTVTGLAWTGDPTTLESCGGTKLESDDILMCDSGTPFIRWIAKKEGEPTGVTFDTDLNSQPYTVTDPANVTYGGCKTSCVKAPLGVVNSWAN